ncbi:protein TIC 55, chloroplastic [Iris pallida]|uniref:Protein TIC 55, chloroplastic n=1 Tax=Iris pallida TaxID=29817 RepID=A0AAX6H998_IRIPA|nr:protein TIC 55, chloroplastic [Iris pallida]
MALSRAFSVPHQLLKKQPTSSTYSSSSSSTSSFFCDYHQYQKKKPSLLLNGRRVATRRRVGLVEPTAVEDEEEYDWREEWYPLYLSEEVPYDAPLGLSVFDEKLVLYRDANGIMRCFQDRCPHRLAKLSEGQLIDGRLECLYHGWQFGGDGRCLKIPQLPEGAQIPRAACATKYEVKDSQGVVWVWMSKKAAPEPDKLPHFEHYSRPDFHAVSTIHEMPYDHSIVLENFMDPAHVPISHDRSDFYSKREDAQPLLFDVTERTPRGFAGSWSKSREPADKNHLRFEAPCALQNNRDYVDRDGKRQHVSSLFLARPTGQGRSMVIIRFGTTLRSPFMKFLPGWFFHQNICKVLEQDMGFLSSQNQVLADAKLPVSRLYLNIASCDTWVSEYRRWKDKVGDGMPYYFGYASVSLPDEPAVVEQAPAGIGAGMSASMPAKGGLGGAYVPNPISRYFRHVVHCRECRGSLKSFGIWKDALLGLALVALSSAVLASSRRWKVVFLVSAVLSSIGGYVLHSASALLTTNFVRNHRRL